MAVIREDVDALCQKDCFEASCKTNLLMLDAAAPGAWPGQGRLVQDRFCSDASTSFDGWDGGEESDVPSEAGTDEGSTSGDGDDGDARAIFAFDEELEVAAAGGPGEEEADFADSEGGSTSFPTRKLRLADIFFLEA